MKRIAGWLMALVIVFSLAAASAASTQWVSCPEGGFSVKLPEKFREQEIDSRSDPDLCFFWSGTYLQVMAYASYQGEIGVTDLFVVLTGNETEDYYDTINGMDMRCIRSEEGSAITVTYTWMDMGNNVTLEFHYHADDPSSVPDTVSSIMKSITFDAGR